MRPRGIATTGYRLRVIALLLFALGCFCHPLFAQQVKVDSLKKALRNHPASDTIKVALWYNIARELVNVSKYDEALRYVDSSMALSQSIPHKPGLANSYRVLAIILHNQDKHSAALASSTTALKLFETLQDKLGIARCYNQIANNYTALKDTNDIRYLHMARQIWEELNDKSGLAIVNTNLGNAYQRRRDHYEAIKYYNIALQLFRELGSSNSIGKPLFSLGESYKALRKYPEALRNYIQAATISQDFGDMSLLAASCYGIGVIEETRENYTEALKYYLKSLKITESLKQESRSAVMHYFVGRAYTRLSQYPEALTYLIPAISKLEEFKIIELVEPAASFAGSVYTEMHDYPAALKVYNQLLEFGNKSHNKLIVARAYQAIGALFLYQNIYKEALENFHSSLKISEEINSKKDVMFNSERIATTHIHTRNYKEARKYLNKALSDSFEIDQVLVNTYDALLALDSLQGNFREAYTHGYLRAIYVDSFNRRIHSLQNDEMKEKYEAERRDKEIVQLQGEKERLESEKQIGALLLKSKQDSLLVAESEREKIALENDKINALNLYSQQQILFLGNEKKLQQLQIENSRAENAKQKAENLGRQDKIALLSKEKELIGKEKQLQSIELAKERNLKRLSLVGLCLVLAVSALGYNSYRTRQKLKLASLRNRIASDLHDEIGSTLSSIAIFSQVAQQQSKETGPMLQTIEESSRKMLDAMADIVWTINPENDQFEKIILRMRSFAYELLGAKSIDFDFKADQDIARLKLPMDVRKNLYLIFKEATNNMVKYAGADKAVFRLKGEEKNYLTMLIRDNGKGFDAAKESQGNGLRNMRMRAEEIGAKLKVESMPGSGTCIELRLAI
jgi:signal transduction histidine kinase